VLLAKSSNVAVIVCVDRFEDENVGVEQFITVDGTEINNSVCAFSVVTWEDVDLN
jgi:hypothetical protein